jgi:hypothetical protein
MAMKIATISNVFRVLGRMPPAMRSERRTSSLLAAVVAIESVSSIKRLQFRLYAIHTIEFTTLRVIHADAPVQQ